MDATTTTPSVPAKPDGWVPMTHLLVELRQVVADTIPAGLNYIRLQRLAASGAIVPALMQHKGRWGCQRERLPELAERLGLPVQTAGARPPQHQPADQRASARHPPAPAGARWGRRLIVVERVPADAGGIADYATESQPGAHPERFASMHSIDPGLLEARAIADRVAPSHCADPLHNSIFHAIAACIEARFLRAWTRRPEYRAAVAAGGSRFDLDGLPSGEVTAEQQAGAGGPS